MSRYLVTRTALLFVLGAACAGSVRAQSPEEPTLAFTISAGLSTGGDLWQINKQVLRAPSGAQDTATVGRRLRPGITAALGVTYYRSPHFGLNAEIAYYGLGTEQSCSGPATFSDGFNQEVCTGANGTHVSSSVVAFQGGGVWNLGSPERTTPYVRTDIGLGYLENTFVETEALIADPQCNTVDNTCIVKIITERNPKTFTWTVSLAAGLAFPVGTGYRFRMEARDLITALPVIDQPALIGVNAQPVSASHMRVKSIPIITFGLDVLLERSHPRRY